MILGLLCILIISGSESRILSVNPKLKRSNKPLEIHTDVNKASSEGDSNRRNKRYASDDHGSDWNNKINITRSVLANDAHGTAYVEWGGTDKNSDTILVLTRDSSDPPKASTLYVSTDYGRTFEIMNVAVRNEKVEHIFSYIYQSESNHELFMLNDETYKAVIVSTNEGKTWTSYPTDFTPSYIEHHPTVERLLLAHDTKTNQLYLSRDFGRSFKQLLVNQNVTQFFWGTSQYDSQTTVFVVIDNARGDETFSVYSSPDFFATSKNLIDDSVIEFTLVDDFYFYNKKSTHTNHGNHDLDLFISYDRSTAVKANFPPNAKDNPTTEFYIADAGEGQAFVAVSHKDNETHLYITEHKGQNMILSLERILFTNQASYDRIAWLDESVAPFTDFEAIEGMSGVFIASQLDNGRVGHRRIHTVMTYNKGGTWQYVQPPRFDMNGNPSECFLPDCALHISLEFGVQYPYAKHTPLLSKENAPGLIIASGNMGRSHSTVNDVFMSNDGGVEWFQVLEGQYHFQIADHGGVVVAAPRTSTRSIMYSHDEGVTWYNKTISPDRDITIYGLITEPGEITTVFNVYATENVGLEWIIFTIDFKDFLGPKCYANDFMTWSIRDELKNTECVLGKDTKYERKKPTSHCYIGEDYKRFVEDKPCPCQASDFECDFLYYRENAGDPCVMVDGVSEDWFIPTDCNPGHKYNRSMGYIKIEGDMCQGGEEAIFSYKQTRCPDQNMTVNIHVSPNITVQVGATVTFDAHTDTYVDDIYFLWHITDNTTFSGTGTKGARFENTFSKPGTYVVSLTANNGAGPVVSMVVMEVDDVITGLVLKYEPPDPAIEEGMIFVVTTTSDSSGQDIARLKYRWSTGVESYLPILLYAFDEPGRQTVTCTVYNSVNSLDLTATFTVSDLTVTSLGAIPVSSSSIQVVWNAPALRPGLVSGYTLEYQAGVDGHDRWHQLSTGGNASQTHYQVNGLTDNTLYQFLIKTTSSGGTQSKESTVVTATTLPMNSLDPAKGVKAVLSGHEVTVSWTTPGGSVNGFVVEYWMSDRPNEIKSHATGSKSDTSLKLTDLIAGAPYSIRVKTLYPNSVVAYSNPVINVQIEGTTPEDLEDVRAFPENSTAIVIVWNKPKIPVEGYDIYNATDSSMLTMVKDTQVTITGLLPYTQYMFFIEPFTGSRMGRKTATIRVTTDTGVPSPVQDLNCFTKNGAAVLTWRKPARPNGPIDKYLIYYVDPSLSEMGIPSYVNKDTHSLTLPKTLKQFALYKFSVAVQGPQYTSQQAYTTCSIESASGVPGPPTDLYVKETHISYIDLMWRHPLISEDNLSYEIRYGVYMNGARIGSEQVVTTDNLYTTLRAGISPSTEYEITVAAKNEKGVGTPSKPVMVVTLTPPIGSVEYEFKFNAVDINSQSLDNFENALKEEIVQVTKISRGRLAGFGVTHEDSSDMKVSIWIVPRDTPDDSVEPSTETVTAALDEKIKKDEFVVGQSKAISGKVDHVVQRNGSRHDVAEIVIPGICGLVIVVLVAGLLYYRNRYQHLMRRYTFRSRYANNDTDDVNLIECADEAEGISSSDLGRGALSISNEGSTQRPRGIRNFFERFNYTQVDQNEPDELIDDDEEHLLPL